MFPLGLNLNRLLAEEQQSASAAESHKPSDKSGRVANLSRHK
jgi:hypothetical protein